MVMVIKYMHDCPGDINNYGLDWLACLFGLVFS